MYPVWWARHIYSCWVQVSHKVANKEGLLLFWPMLKMCPHLKCFLCAHVEFDGTCRFLPLWHCAETVWSVNYNFYVYIQLMYYFSTFPSHIVAPGISFMQITSGLPSECCDAMDKIDLATVDLQLLSVFWEHGVDWDSKTIVCKVCIDLLPVMQAAVALLGA